MTATIDPKRWLTFLWGEYLDTFIRDGGTSIKFVVPLDETTRPEIENEIASRAEGAGYLGARVSSGDTRVHMIDQLFFRVADQIPWRQLSKNVLTRFAESAGYALPPQQEGSGAFAVRLAAANPNLDPEYLRIQGQPWIQNQVFGQRSLAKDFRVAVTQLCLAELLGGPDGETKIEVITDWLTGRNKAVAAVKPYQIFTKVTRNNARHLLESLLRWVRFAGYPGLVIMMDISRVTIPRNPHDELLFYRKPAMFDSYEVLRQFIDATDRMKGCLMVVMPALDFLDQEPSGRGMGAYSALNSRVYDEVRDSQLVNPMAALVRLAPGGNVA